MAPTIINVGSNFGYLEIRQGWNSGHGLVEVFAVDNQFSLSTIIHQADNLFKMIVHKIGCIQGGIDSAKAATIFLMAVAAMRLIELLPLEIILVEFNG